MDGYAGIAGIGGTWRRLLLVAAAAVLGLAPGARAGTVIDVKTVYFGDKRPAETARIYLDRGCVRFDAVEDGRSTTMIFRIGDKGEPLCWVIDTMSKTYDEFTLKNVEKNAPVARTVEFQKIASGVKLGGWVCTQYEAYVKGVKQEDLWTARAEALGLAAADIEVLREMGEFFSRLSAETNAFFEIGRAGEGRFDGFPVVVVEYQNGRKRERSEVTSSRKEALAPSVFELPAGARRRAVLDRP